jgi:hypothetical protein
MKSFSILLIISLISSFSFDGEKLISTRQADKITNCEWKDIPLQGKVQFVESFPDFTIKFVDNFADIKVRYVSSFPDKCGKWQVVESFPDFKVQIVSSFPDVKVQIVDAFPGMP